MQRFSRWRRAAIVTALVVVATLLAAPLLAHEGRQVGGYDIEVGLIGEPVFVGQKSGLEFFVHHGDQPVEGLETTVTAEVIFGSVRRALPLSPRAGEPGAYESVFFPTAPGPYTFHLSGKIEATEIDESFTSSPDGFGEVQAVTAGQFPVVLGAADELAAQAKRGADAADRVTIAIVVGGVALLVALLALGLSLAARQR